MNYLLLQYCFDQEITFTRARPYKKNDQCFVEQKNGSIIRRFVGYDRFEGLQPCWVLSALYEQLRPYVNFFQPSVKLISKTREGARVRKKYDRAQTPYQRLLADEGLPDTVKQELTEQYQELDPVKLLVNIRKLQDQLWELAYVEREMLGQESLPTGTPPSLSRSPRTAAEYPKNERSNPSHPKLDPAERMYRRTKKPRKDGQGKRWWRTRADPFSAVRHEMEAALEREPYLNAKALLAKLQQKHPGKFHEGQLRTLQRRVKAWRVRQADRSVSNEFVPDGQPSSPTEDELG